MARPRLDPVDKRVTKSTSFNARELEKVEANAARAHTNVSEFIRVASLNAKFNVVESTVPEFAYRHDLRTIGGQLHGAMNNLNQLTKLYHMEGVQPPEALEEVLASVPDLLNRIDNLLYDWMSHGTPSRENGFQL